MMMLERIANLGLPAIETTVPQGEPAAVAMAEVDIVETVAPLPEPEKVLSWQPSVAIRFASWGASTAALTRAVARREGGEPATVTKMREVASRYLAMRFEVAAQMARITVG